MDLISRKAEIEACIEVSKQEEEHSKMWATGLRYAKRILTEVPSAPAVPLDKLCLLLHDIIGCPCHTKPGEDMCNQLIVDQCNIEWDEVECWKQFLTKWMEEQDAGN